MSTSYDPVPELLANTESGQCSRIEYAVGESTTVRVIEPRGLIESPDGLLIRAIQREPGRSARHFAASRIVKVEPCETPLVPGEGVFSTDDVMVIRRSRHSGHTNPLESPDFKEYLAAIRDAVSDLHIEAWEFDRIKEIRTTRKMSAEACRAAHALVYSEYLLAYGSDGCLDEPEQEHLAELAACLEELGWRPV